jgi:dipeptidyl aminopeptidase/acylaminoacyl peptidase
MEMKRIGRATLIFLVAAGFFLLISVPVVAAATSHPFTVRDLVMLQRVGTPSPSPDSSAIYYLSTRSGSSQVWKIAPSGGDAVQVTNLPLDLANLKISPDGKSLAFSLRVFPGTRIDETTARQKGIEERNSSGRVYDTLPVRHWDMYNDGQRNHIFVMPLATGIPVDIMNAMDADSPSMPFGGSEEYTFTPDSAGIIFSAGDSGREEMWTTKRSLWLAGVSGSGRPTSLTPANRAGITSPAFSPDGSTLAFLAQTVPGYESDRYRIMLRSWPAGQDREVAPSWDRSPSSLAWSLDGKSLYVTAADTGNTGLFAIDPTTGSVRTLISKGSVSSVSTTGNRLVFTRANMTSPADIWTIDPDGTHATRITQVNRDQLAATRMGDYEPFSFAGWNNETVYGYVVKPVDFDPAKKYPVALLIHGGPEGSFPDEFSYRWNPEVFAGRGYAVVMIDFHGSAGYGQVFTESIQGDWGGKPLVDLQKGLNASLEQNPWMDETRVSALGASYGGFMTAWIEGAWPDRFRCLVMHDGIFDTRSLYFSTDELWFMEWENNGTPWENPEAYSRFNPADHVADWRTPMLVIQGGEDYRVPDGQGLGAFTTLQRRNIPGRLLYFPDENHWVLKPQNSIQWYDTVLDWLDQWNGNIPPAVTRPADILPEKVPAFFPAWPVATRIP